jgi:predicted O-linked N-acetylglucosamine transferase (SPINDLY family)
MSTETACELIRADGIDILIDLSGHTGYHRLDVFAKKPAPVQISWLGFITTTGIATVDYFAADSVILNEQTASAFVEKPLSFYHWAPLPEDIPELDSYEKDDESFYFGSFNNAFKYNDMVFELWAEIMRQAPHAKLLLKDKKLNDSTVSARIRRFFEEAGISSERIELIAAVPTREEHFQYYRRLDLALDPFPTGGAATTIEALAMGVPTLSWVYQMSRASCYFTASTSKLMGIFDETIAFDRDEYIQKALAFYRNPLLLNRSKIAKLARSLLGSERYASKFVRSLRKVWNEHVETTCE